MFDEVAYCELSTSFVFDEQSLRRLSIDKFDSSQQTELLLVLTEAKCFAGELSISEVIQNRVEGVSLDYVYVSHTSLDA